MGDVKKTLEFQGEMPMGSASKYHPDAIVEFAKAVNPTKVEAVGTAYEGVSKTFGDSLKTFQDMAQRLSEAWTGEDASVEAQRQLALLYVAAMTMQTSAQQIGGSIKNFASLTPDYSKHTTVYSGAYGLPATTSYDASSDSDVPLSLAQFKNLVTSNDTYFAGQDIAPLVESTYQTIPTSDGKYVEITRDTPANQRGLYAQYLLDQQNNGIFSTWQSIPQTVTLDLPPATTNTGGPPKKDKPGPGSTGPGSVKTPHVPSGPGATPTLADSKNLGHGGANLAGLPTGTNGSGTNLSGVGQTPGGGTNLSGIGPVGSGPGGTNLGTGPGGTNLGSPPGLGPTTGLGSGPNPGLGTGGLPGYTPSLLGGGGSSGLGKSGVPGSGATVEGGTVGRGALGAAAAEQAAAANAANAAGRGAGMMPMMPPMMGGAQGAGKEGRERSSWLTEDEDVWGADDDVAPPLIG